ncbi:MAG: DNA translocase FtsK 4TM domain-containing protein [Nitrospirota bacterium]|jgi:S-DNA-T family DNA segregation ATPase FtsK/SpoIIIE
MAVTIKQKVTGVLAVAGGIFLALSLASYSRWDRSLFTYSEEPVGNYGGIVGSYIADALMTLVGAVSYALPLFLLVYGVKRFLGRHGERAHLWGALLFVLSAPVLAGLISVSFGLERGVGGIYGSTLGGVFFKGLSDLGAYIIALALVISALIMLSPMALITAAVGNARAKMPALPRKRLEDLYGEEEPEPEPVEEYFEPLVVEPAFVEEGEEVLEAEEVLEGGAGVGEGYELPPLDLLNLYEPVDRLSKDELLESSQLLERKLQDFSVEGRVVQVHTGPIVTMYEFEPAPGVKISRVSALADDLALSLKARSVRISALPGKAALGIEIPNRNRETVSLREIISSETFRRSSSKLTLALGKDIFGAPVVADLSRMPHLLVAGSTGSGKSVFLNAMITSLIYKASPDEVKMLMIDPKLLELSSYDGIPHLISPVITNPKEAAEMLRKMVYEMERRYRLIAQKGVRNVESFNAEASPDERIPYIVIFIDELADLMFASASRVEDSIARLAQMARASGMHLVLATQRPSVDVITGVIKANFPARVAFHVTSRIDSRTILDAQGAEQLLGKGDMLFMLPGKAMVRVHGALVTEGEVRSVAEFVKGQGSPDFSIMREIDTQVAHQEAEASAAEERDDLYSQVAEYAATMGEVSISSIQRKFKVGYNRAARVMELLEEDGRVGPPRGAGKPRDFLG